MGFTPACPKKCNAQFFIHRSQFSAPSERYRSSTPQIYSMNFFFGLKMEVKTIYKQGRAFFYL